MVVNGTLPGIDIEYNMDSNPCIYSPNAQYGINFRQFPDTLIDVELYKAFIDNVISRFRHSKTYKNYKSNILVSCINKTRNYGFKNPTLKK